MLNLLQAEFTLFGWLLPLSLFGLLLVFWWKSNKDANEKCKIPTMSGIPVLVTFMKLFINNWMGTLHLQPTDYLITFMHGVCNLYYKNKIMKCVWGGRNYIVCIGPTTCESVFNSSVAINKDWTYKFLHYWLGTGLLTSGGDKWRTRRKMLTPAFHFRILKDFLHIFNEQSMILIGKLNKCNKRVININDVIALCTLDIIGESAMGVRLKAQDDGDSAYVQAVKNLTPTMIKWFATPWYWITPIFNLSSTAKAMRKDLSIVHDFARKVIQGRKTTLLQDMENSEAVENFEEDGEDIGIKKRRAFLDLLLYHHVTDKSLSLEDIREEVDTFTFEGHDTTSMGISWTLYLLGLHKDIQEKVYQEAQSIFGEDKERAVTTEDLKEMKYLECVIKETLRLYPSVPLIVRRTIEDIKIGEYIIPANSSVPIFIYGLHRDPEVFPNPEQFDPNRFLPENCVGRHPFAYVPFSAGQRNCIGQRFAMMELKTVVTNIIRNFKVHSLDQRDKLILLGDIILRPKHGLRLVMEKR